MVNLICVLRLMNWFVFLTKFAQEIIANRNANFETKLSLNFYIMIIYEVANSYMDQHNYIDTINALNQAIELCQNHEDLDLLLRIHVTMSECLRNWGKLEEARKYESKAIELIKFVENKHLAAASLEKLAIILETTEYQLAEQYVSRAIKLCPCYEHMFMKLKMSTAHTFNATQDPSLGAKEKGEFLLITLKNADMLIKIAEENENVKVLKSAYIYKAIAYLELGNMDDAYTNYEKSFDAENDEPEVLIERRYIFGIYLFKKEKFEKAYSEFLKAYKEEEKIIKSGWKDDFILMRHNMTIIRQLNGYRLLCEVILKNNDVALATAERSRAFAFKMHLRGYQPEATEPLKSFSLMNQSLLNTGVDIILFSDLIFNFLICWVFSIDIEHGLSIHRKIFEYSEVQNLSVVDNISTKSLHSQMSSISLLPESRKFGIIQKSKIPSEISSFVSLWAELLVMIPPRSTDRRLIIICDGKLWPIPFCSLLDSENNPLVTKYILSYSPSLDLCLTPWIRPNQIENRMSLLIGNPKTQKCTNLKIAEKEVNSIELLLKNLKVIKLINEHATKASVLNLLPHVNLFHIAAHATIDENKNDSIGNSIYPGELLLSSDSKDNKKETDYKLSSEEIQRLNLERLELVFLHCCVTGRGKVFSEGLVGLGRAFIFAGARAVILCREPVPDDDNTLRFSNTFYTNYVNGDPPDVCLTKAQRELYSIDPQSHWASYYIFQQKIC